MTGPRLSIVVASQGRPAHLSLCLTSLAQQLYRPFEVVVVACREGIEAAHASALAGHFKPVPFDPPNLAEARNAGIIESAGDVIAFIDDDAVAEPTWAGHIAAAFELETVDAATGYVRGRNGISFQSQALAVDRAGWDHEIALDGDDPVLLRPGNGRAIRTPGTNMAFRAEVLREAGGFDRAFAFYLEETDLNMRLAAQRTVTAVLPRAQVHHAFASSARRRADRVPQSLFDVGASTALFRRRHDPEFVPAQGLAELEEVQRKRVLRMMADGGLDPSGLHKLMRSLCAGWTEGLTRPLELPEPLARGTAPFHPVGLPVPACHVMLAGRGIDARRLNEAAAKARGAGDLVSVFRFSRTALYHTVRMRPDGSWLQRGGLFGRSDRSDPLFRWWRFSRRLGRETARLGGIRLPLSQTQKKLP